MSSIFQNLQIESYIIQKNDLEAELTDISDDRRLSTLSNNNALSKLQSSYSAQEDYIESKMQGLDKTSAEYKELSAELDRLEDEKEDKEKIIERRITDIENLYDTQQTQKETQLEAVTQDLEALKESRNSNIEKEYSYVDN